MIRSPTLAQSWPIITDKTRLSCAVVRSHLLACPNGLTARELAERAGLLPYIGDMRAGQQIHVDAVLDRLRELEDIGAAVEVDERWYDALALERANRVRQRRVKFALDFVA